MTAIAAARPLPARRPNASEREWAVIAERAPQLAVTGRRYLEQIGLSLTASSVVVADATLRTFTGYLLDEHGDVEAFAQVGRPQIEGFKRSMARHRTRTGGLLSARTIRHRLGTLRTFFDRMIEWDWPDAPARTPIFAADLPVVDDPLPRFLDDADAARLMRAAAETDPISRLVIELLAHTGLRVGELCALQADAVVQMGGAWWLRVPVGKLHNDRYVPLLATLVEQIAAWTAKHGDAGTGLLLTKDGTPLNRHRVTRMLNRVGKKAGVGNINPHRLRHTLATQAINRGMRLEAIATLLGHRSLRMTMVYARIANRTVADEYHAVSQRVEALYASTEPVETPELRQLRTEHHRMLGNGWCTRPAHLDCSFESICEGCGFFNTTPEFRPTLQRQHDHAVAHGQTARQTRYQQLLDTLDQATR